MHGPGSALGRDPALRLNVNADGSVVTDLPEGNEQVPVAPDAEEGGALTARVREAIVAGG